VSFQLAFESRDVVTLSLLNIDTSMLTVNRFNQSMDQTINSLLKKFAAKSDGLKYVA